jgi:hypothetical protein
MLCSTVASQPDIGAKITYLHTTGKVSVGAMKGVQAWAVGKRELAMGGALAAVSVCRLQHHKGGEEDTNEEQEFLDCHFLAI